MSKDTRIRYCLKWMNRSRFKDEKGHLIIKTTPVYEALPEDEKQYGNVDQQGYAVQLIRLDQSLCDCLNFSDPELKSEKKWITLSQEPIKANDRWIHRVNEREMERLKSKIAFYEGSLKDLNDQLAKIGKEV
jgi:hypothetical protein